jgi:nitroimidazol reductase NimA-like FMN-containing flavoprotein (pyridoxamine 5'-phosphate oxidase superfamily)
MSEHDHDLEVLTRAECLSLLRANSFGRVALVVDGRPLVFPVNYGMEGDIVVFRTGAGTKLRWAPMRRVAFEVDEIDRDRGLAWSVLVQGVAQDVARAAGGRGRALRSVTVEPAAPGQRDHRLAIDTREISGRRFALR